MAKSTKSVLKSAAMLSASAMVLGVFALPSAGFAQNANEVKEEEVVVTATRRTEKLADVPIAISVFSAKDVAQTGASQLSQLTGYIPNVQVTQATDFRSAVYIRGVGSNSRNIGFDSRVGVYVDGVYMGQSPAVNQDLLDLSRVEVLRGPQGVLFGKNNVAGAIALVTKKPGTEFEGLVSANIGNLDLTEFRAMVNIPLGDKMANKFSIAKVDRDGYINNLGTGNKLNTKDSLSMRDQIRINPSDKLEIILSADYTNSKGYVFLGKPWTNMLGSALLTGPATEPNNVNFSFDPPESRHLYGFAGDISYRFANDFELRSITAYRYTNARIANATDYSPVDIIHINYNDTFKQTSEELQLISPRDAKLTYMLGAFFYKQEAETNRDVTLGTHFLDAFIAGAAGLPSTTPTATLQAIATSLGFGRPGDRIINAGTVNTDAWAIYFNGAYELSDKLKLGFGLRYSDESKDNNWLLDGTKSGLFRIGTTNPDPVTGAGRVRPGSRKDTHFAPAVSLTYKVNDTANVYVKYATAYKSGGFNLDYINANELAANPNLQFKKETVGSYEIGLKSSYFNRRLTLDAALFQADYDDFQVNQFVDLGGGRTSIRITNAAKVVTKGFEVEASAKLTPEFTLRSTLGLLDATYDNFPGGASGGANASGKKLGSPDKTFTLTAIYNHSFSNDVGLNIRADYNYYSEYYITPDNIKTFTLANGQKLPYGEIPATRLLNGRISLTSPNKKYEVSLWGKNITDEYVYVDMLRDFFNTYTYLPGLPRQYGIELIAKF